MARYSEPNWFMTRLANPFFELLIRRFGISPAGAQVLEVRGRKSGQPRTVPVNPIELEGQRYLVAPRGETQWVRNFRAAGEGVLQLGGKREPIVGQELPDSEKVPVLKAYLDKYRWEVGSEFGVSKHPTDAELGEIAPNHPIFSVESKQSAARGA